MIYIYIYIYIYRKSISARSKHCIRTYFNEWLSLIDNFIITANVICVNFDPFDEMPSDVRHSGDYVLNCNCLKAERMLYFN